MDVEGVRGGSQSPKDSTTQNDNHDAIGEDPYVLIIR